MKIYQNIEDLPCNNCNPIFMGSKIKPQIKINSLKKQKHRYLTHISEKKEKSTSNTTLTQHKTSFKPFDILLS